MQPIKIKPGLCKNCYACIRACEVKATSIRLGQASIIDEECLACGACIAACPQHAREIQNDVAAALNLLRGTAPVWVSLAPSAAAGPYSFGQWEKALLSRGFAGVSLTSWGAIAATKAYEAMAREQGYVLTTACPAAVKLVTRYFPGSTRHLAPVASPMLNHGAWLKETYGAKVVFIGPCAAKKSEARGSQQIDLTLTFSEAEELVGPMPDADDKDYSQQGLVHFPVPGGLKSQTSLPVLAIDGLEELMPFLERVSNGSYVPQGIVEMSACKGSCLGGADAYCKNLSMAERRARITSLLEDGGHHPAKAITSRYNPQAGRPPAVGEEKIQEVLEQLGKADPSLEYNCASCGYHTCREKAEAVALGRAELEMCLPFMRAKAESLSNLILSSTPSGVVVVDREMLVQEWNEAATNMFGMSAQEIRGLPLDAYLPTEDYRAVLEGQESKSGTKLSLTNGKTVVLTCSPVKGGELIMGVYQDITQLEEQEKALRKVRKETLEKTQEVINKQMRVAQEIAGLLGETTAESKMLLLKLIKVVQGEV